GTLNTVPVLRGLLRSAKGTDTRRHATEELARPLGGTLNIVPVLRGLLRSAKGADARHQANKELADSSGGALDTLPVLAVFLRSVAGSRTRLRFPVFGAFLKNMPADPRTSGKLYLIGAGPGDPELLTLKAVRALGESDVILYDRLVSTEALQFAKSGA